MYKRSFHVHRLIIRVVNYCNNEVHEDDKADEHQEDPHYPGDSLH